MKENKVCFILYSFSSLCFLLSGILSLVEQNPNVWQGITSIALAVTFASLAVLYFKKYKSSK